MKEMEQNFYNNSYRYLLPLYNYNYIIDNDVIKYIGTYCECPYYPSVNNNLFITYEIKNINKIDNLDLPNVYSKHIRKIDSNQILILELNPPKDFTKDWINLLECNFSDVSWTCKHKIINSQLNKPIREFVSEALCNHVNYCINQNSKTYLTSFDSSDILDW